ncbi:hypothetical protein THRCLA_02744 [Thraustotheca clavata]|uniref:Uncharacterized protein n=1 Tax=Thraustotheca clavata TaxID=74557 RepID=A0A1W0A462_9STRA|nr:hypothetical protein THRCLA_02744 [Thraustotheca clavata]
MANASVAELQAMVEYRLTREEIANVLASNNGDVTATTDELLCKLKIMDMQITEDNSSNDSKLQWNLFTKELSEYGVDESNCNELLQLIKNASSSDQFTSSEVVLRLLSAMDNEEEELHPIQKLQEQFPNVGVELIQDTFEQHNYDLKATAKALENIGYLFDDNGNVANYSCASVAKGPQKKKQQSSKKRNEFPRLKPKFRPLDLSCTKGVNAWENKDQALPTGTPGSLSTRLKLEYLQQRLPTIDSDIICTALLLNEGNLETTESTLQSIFMIESSSNQETQEEHPRQPTFHPPRHRQDNDIHDYAYYHAQTKQLMEKIHELHCASVRSLTSGRLNQHLGREKMLEIAPLRRQLQINRENAAEAFFEENKPNILSGGIVDLHGLYHQEAIWVLDKCLSFSKEAGVRKFTIVTGLGRHSPTSGKLYKGVHESLSRRGVNFVRGQGNYIIHPFSSL